MAFEFQNGSPTLPADFLRQVDQATGEFSDKERMIFLQGVSLAMGFACAGITNLTMLLKNSTPDLLRGPVTVRRVGI
jgi:hypothetical protein